MLTIFRIHFDCSSNRKIFFAAQRYSSETIAEKIDGGVRGASLKHFFTMNYGPAWKTLLIISILSPAILADTSKDNIIQQFEGKHVFGLSFYKNLLAVALVSEIDLSIITKQNDDILIEKKATLNISDGTNLSNLLEFKLINESSIFYCTPNGCK